MPHFNLVQSESRQPGNMFCKFKFQRSAKGQVEIPYSIHRYSHFCDYLDKHIPDEWQFELNALFQAELDIVNRRRELVAKYREQMPLFQQYANQYLSEHPEMLI
jgi:hypothetical protein